MDLFFSFCDKTIENIINNLIVDRGKLFLEILFLCNIKK